MNSEAAVHCRCGWVIITQLLGEERCFLALGHGGDHRFGDHQRLDDSHDEPNRNQTWRQPVRDA